MHVGSAGRFRPAAIRSVLAALRLAALPCLTRAATFTVTKTARHEGRSLRRRLLPARGGRRRRGSRADTIRLPAGTYNLSLPGTPPL